MPRQHSLHEIHQRLQRILPERLLEVMSVGRVELQRRRWRAGGLLLGHADKDREQALKEVGALEVAVVVDKEVD